MGMKRREFMTLVGGAAATWPLGARAQQTKVYRIAIVHPSSRVADMSETSGPPTYKALFGELRRLGYVEGINLTVERYSGEGRTEHYAELASDVVRQKADLILVSSSRMVQNFKAATWTIPIVGLMADPVAFGIVISLAHPGGNITGISVDAGLEIWGKRLEFLRETIQLASKVGFLASRAVRDGPQGAAILEAARRMGMLVIGPPLEGTIQEAEYQRVFEAMTQEHADALVVSDQPEHFTNRRLIMELAEKQRLPAIYPYRQYVEQGGLMAYAIDLVGLYRRAADYIDQILKGANPGEIPVYQEDKLELVINVKAAKAIGVTIPPALLLRADEVVE
jgi:putative ABC transport system substrate-binding protein